MISLKMIILGNVRVGKTALMYRFLHGIYSDSLPTTVSFSCSIRIYVITVGLLIVVLHMQCKNIVEGQILVFP